ncbi:MAG: PIN domain-containing protein [Pirellulaceae bacterium]|nr:PIN domain-containing protein [Pirellulaceae bacterium]
MALIVLRCVFMFVAIGLTSLLVRSDAMRMGPAWLPWLIFFSILLVAAAVIVIDMFVPNKRIDTISAVYFGTLVGMVLTYALTIALEPLLGQVNQYGDAVRIGLGVVLVYTCISLLLQTKDDFRFIIPYVEFSKDVKGLKPYVLDTSVVIDGRVADLVETEIFDNTLIMPRFVLSELQRIADSSDKLRRSRGRRGLDILNRLRSDKRVDLKIYDRDLAELSGHPVDMKLVLLAKHLGGKIITGDYNLNKVARLHNVPVINLNDVANALKPVYLPGEGFSVRIVKPGEAVGQGVGYLDDGTMIVVEDGRDHIGQTVRITVTSVLQTSAGRMIFGRFEAIVKATTDEDDSA